ncbi:hypothetical protein OUZ56_011460 [Daphnia magna]|uniref:Uncharacterized protein n=1 Tax=Daphnia magna TaxID=35525 RepID=A0ABQ9Z072_9CRUS|nr:hypothetical protein OUZ56_011460 [Daphnia magna]
MATAVDLELGFPSDLFPLCDIALLQLQSNDFVGRKRQTLNSEHSITMAQNYLVGRKRQTLNSPSDKGMKVNSISAVLKHSLSVVPCPDGTEHLWDRIICYVGLGYSVRRIT